MPCPWSRPVRLVLALGVLGFTARAQDEIPDASIEGRPANAVVLVGAGNNMYPYAYEEGGQLRGFAVDIFDAVATEMGIRASRLPINSRNAGEALEQGRIDVILFWADTPARRAKMAVSTPLLTLQLAVIVRADDPRITHPADLAGRVIATGASGTVASTFVRERLPTAKEVHSDDPEELLRQVSSGLADAGLLSRLTAMARIERMGLRNLRVLETGIDSHDVRYCFMVRRGDDRLLARLNEGITLIHRNGTYAKIYDSWFGRLEPRRFSREQVVAYVAAALALGLVVVSVALVRQRRLSRRIAAQGSELLAERSLHGVLFEHHPLAAWVLESDGRDRPPRLISLNPAAARLCGLTPAGATGRLLPELPLPQDIARLFAEVATRWPEDGQPARFVHPGSGADRTLEATLQPLADGPAGRRRLCVLAAGGPRRDTAV